MFSRGPKRENLPAVDFECNIKVNKQYLNTRVFVDGVCEELVELLGEYFVLYAKQLTTLIDKLTANAKYIEKHRATIEYGPKNKVAVSKFLQEVSWDKTPLGAYVATQRLVKEEKLKLLRESMEEDGKNSKNMKTAFDSDEDIEMSDASQDDD
ncbi:unnamed protein product [Pichia kudriavzevii]